MVEQVCKQVPKLKTLEAFRPEIGEFMVQKYNEGHGYEMISKLIEKEFNYKISHMGVSRYLKKKFSEMGETLEENPDLMKKSTDLFLDTVEQMKQLNSKLWSLMGVLKETKANIPEIINISKEIRSQVELQNKLLGKLHTGTQINIGKAENVNSISIAMAVNQHLEKMQEKGYIVIKKDLKRVDSVERFEEELVDKSKIIDAEIV